jgi:hypothetical protein
MEEKFHWLVDPVLGRNRADGLVEMVWRFDEQAGVDRLIRETLCRASPPRTNPDSPKNGG